MLSSMQFLRTYRVGLVAGFLFGTVGVFLLALLALWSSAVETMISPFLWPGRWMASVIARDGMLSSWTVTLLYLLSGAFYAIAGLFVQWIVLKMRRGHGTV